jgi:DNA-binding transcriptional regulator YhcF (GntR family)
MAEQPTSLVETLRGRILRGLHGGTLRAGDRLPSARDLVAEFLTDHRPILAAYRQLAEEGLVEIRPRGGVYVAHAAIPGQSGKPFPDAWLALTYAEGYAREIPGPELAELLRRSIETLRLRAVIVTTTDDQVAGLVRELRDDFGLAADGFTASALAASSEHPAAIKRADILMATIAHADMVKGVADSLGTPYLTVDVRPDLVVGEWAMLLRQPVWAVVATAEFGEMLRRFFANVKGVENLHVLVHGRDDLAAIPEGALTYVTSRVRAELEGQPIRGKLLPSARTIAMSSARQIFEYVVSANLRAMSALRPSSGTSSDDPL